MSGFHKLGVCLLALSVGQSASAQAAPRKAAPSPPDVAIRSTYTSGGQVSVNKTYFKGARERFDFPGVSVITQCDRKRSLQLNAATRRFLVVSGVPPVAQPAGGSDAPPSPPQGAIISETTTLSDTGERKTMFGLEARHIKTVTVRQPDANACDPQGSRGRDRRVVRRPAGSRRVPCRTDAIRARRCGRSGLYRSHRGTAGRRREAGVRPQYHDHDDRGRRQGHQDHGHGSHRPPGSSISRRGAIRRAAGLYRGQEPSRALAVSLGPRQPGRCRLRLAGGRHPHVGRQETGGPPDRHRRPAQRERPGAVAAVAARRLDRQLEQVP